jgi:hypothetical protein
LGGFTAAVRAARFSGASLVQLAAGTVSDAVNHVAVSFVEAGLPDPRQSATGAPSRLLQRQYQNYRNLDKDLKQQKAITASILFDMEKQARLPIFSSAARAATKLAIGAFFFGMRSCEYTHVSGPRRTKQLRVRSLRFFRHNKVMALTDPLLPSALAVSVTFEFQKTDVRSETVHQHATGLKLLCPIVMWSRVVQWILAYPGCNKDSLVSTIIINDARKLVTATFLATSRLRTLGPTPFARGPPWRCISLACQFLPSC